MKLWKKGAKRTKTLSIFCTKDCSMESHHSGAFGIRKVEKIS